MSKELQDGLILDNSYYLIDEKKPGFPIYARVIQYLMIAIGIWSSFSALISCVQIPVIKVYINLAILLCVGIVFALCLISSYDIIKQLLSLLLYCLFFYSRFKRIQNGFFILENLVFERIAEYYNLHRLRFVADYSSAEEDVTLLMVMIIIPFASLLTIAIVRSRYTTFSSIMLSIPVVICFLLGITPPEANLVTFVAVELYLIRSHFSMHHLINKEQKTLLHRINSRAALWMSLFSIFLFFMMKLFLSEQRYENISEIKEVKKEVQTALFEMSIEDITKRFTDIRIKNNNLANGGLNGGELGKMGKVEYTDSDQLIIKAPYASVAEGLYLKGYVGSVYTGSKWEGHSSSDKKKYKKLEEKLSKEDFFPVNQTNLLLSQVTENAERSSESAFYSIENSIFRISRYNIYQGSLAVEYVDANKKYMYAPYFTDYEILKDIYYEQDLYAAPKVKKKNYYFVYYFNLSTGDPPTAFIDHLDSFASSYTEYEDLYRDFVYEVYTKLPEEGLDRLKEDFTRETYRYRSISERIEFVMDYLHNNTSYSLTPGKLPQGEDFVEYFLYDNRVGYCAHYASAATLMLRAMGIPARYVEGYAVGPEQASNYFSGEMQTVKTYTETATDEIDMMLVELPVKDYNAHAWVEVYIDGCGWIPVEFTPGAAIEYNTAIMDELTLVDDYLEDVEEKEETTPTPTPSPSPSPSPTPKEEEKEETKEEETKQQQSSDEGKEEAEQNGSEGISPLLIGGLIVVAVGVSLTIVILTKRKMKTMGSYNRRVIILFAQMEKILWFSKGLPGKVARLEDHEDYVIENCPYIDVDRFEHCMDIVKRARFGKDSIQLVEFVEVKLLYEDLYQEVYNKLTFIKKLYLKWLLFL